MTADFLNLNATLAVEVAVFVIVLAVLGRFVIKPLQSAMRRRQAEIDESMAQARRAEELLVSAEADYRATLERARLEARRIIETAQRMAEDSSRAGRGSAPGGPPPTGRGPAAGLVTSTSGGGRQGPRGSNDPGPSVGATT